MSERKGQKEYLALHTGRYFQTAEVREIAVCCVADNLSLALETVVFECFIAKGLQRSFALWIGRRQRKVGASLELEIKLELGEEPKVSGDGLL